MKKNIIVVFTCISMFFCGFYVSKIPMPERTLDDTQFSEDNQNEIITTQEDYSLSLVEEEFLEEYLYGQWRFVERVVETPYNRAISNVSDTGVEEFKQLVIEYKTNFIQFSVDVSRFTVTNSHDMYLFGKRGGFQVVQNPLYYVEEMNSNVIRLKDAYHYTGFGEDIEFEGAENFIKVGYYTPFEAGHYNSRKISDNFGNIIYINPNEEDIIYLEFYGLWKLERDTNWYGTPGKSEI